VDAWAAGRATQAVGTIDAYKKHLEMAAERAAAAAAQLAARVATHASPKNGAAPAVVEFVQTTAAAPAPGAPEMAAAVAVAHPLGDGESEDNIVEDEELDLGLVLMLG